MGTFTSSHASQGAFPDNNPERLRVGGLDRLHILLICTYVPIAGFFWFPGVSPFFLSVLKQGLFASIFALSLLSFRNIEKRIFILLSVLAVCGFASFLSITVSGDVTYALLRLRAYIEVVVWLFALSSIKQHALPLFLRTLAGSVWIAAAVSLYPVGVLLGLFPVLHAPLSLVFADGEFVSRLFDPLSSIVVGGFVGTRTGWGVVLSQLVILSIVLSPWVVRRPTRRAALVIALSVVAFVVLLASGSRGGTLALLVGLAFVFFKQRRRRPAEVWLVASLFVVAILSDVWRFVPAEFLRGFQGGGGFLERINAASTGRIESYFAGMRLFADSPLVGVGSDALVHIGSGGGVVRVHNLWLRLLAEGGLISFVPWAIATVMIIGWGVLGPAHRRLIDARPVVVLGLVLALIEPSMLIGGFNSSVIFWTSLWLCLTHLSPHRRSLQVGRYV